MNSAEVRRSIEIVGVFVNASLDEIARAVEPAREQLLLLRPDAGEARQRRKQRIEQRRAHRATLSPVADVSAHVLAVLVGLQTDRVDAVHRQFLIAFIGIARDADRTEHRRPRAEHRTGAARVRETHQQRPGQVRGVRGEPRRCRCHDPA